MKRNIILVILVIVIAVIIGYTLYYFTNIDNEVNNEKVNDNNNTEENDTITLTNEELEKYLSYLPTLNESSLESINKDNLLEHVLSYAYVNDYFVSTTFNNEEDYTAINDYLSIYNKLNYVEEKEIDELLQTMYNLSLDDFDIEESGEEIIYIAEYIGSCFFYYENGFVVVACSGGYAQSILNDVISYEVTEDELIIYAYSVTFSYEDYGEETICYLDDVEIDNCDTETYYNEHLEEYSRKYTFKKNDTGYYWYQTEIVS